MAALWHIIILDTEGMITLHIFHHEVVTWKRIGFCWVNPPRDRGAAMLVDLPSSL